IDRPRKASENYKDASGAQYDATTGSERKDNSTRANRDHASDYAPIAILLEEYPGEQSRENTFEIEKQRRCGSLSGRQSEHQQSWTYCATKNDRSEKPGQIKLRDRRG